MPSTIVVHPTERNRFHSLVLLGALVLYCAFIFKNSFLLAGTRYFSLFDDGMISMRFARNFAEGHGLVWNPGERPVEGYTNFLWTVYMGLAHLLPVSEAKISLVIMLTGAVILLGNLVVVRKIADDLSGGSPWVSGAAVLLTAVYYPLLYWTLRGMEVGLLTLVTNASLLLALRLEVNVSRGRVGNLAALLGLAVLVRPDAIVPALVVMMFLVWIAWRQKFRLILLLVPAVVVLVWAAHTTFRILYYGDSMPNTYYLKVTGVPAIERIARGFVVFGDCFFFHLWPVVILVLMAFLFRARSLGGAGLWLLLAAFGGQAAYSVYVGGDAWEWMYCSNRYLTVAMPALFIAASLMLVENFKSQSAERLIRLLPLLGIGVLTHAWRMFLDEERFAGFSLIALGLLVGCLGLVVRITPKFRTPLFGGGFAFAILATACLLNFFPYAGWLMGRNSGKQIKEDAASTEIGLRIRAATSPDTSVAVVCAGAVPYFSKRPTIDLLGKSDPAIAKGRPAGPFLPGHNKWDYAYSIDTYQPDLIVELWKPTESDEALIANRGYLKLKNGMFLKQNTKARVDIGTLVGDR